MSIYIFLGPLLYTLCIGSIPVVTARVNIALNGNANQSTTLYYNGFYWNASLATDGFKFGRENPDENRCCSATRTQNHPWWQVDLRSEYYIGKINVYGRTRHTSAQLRGFRLYIIPNRNLASLSDYLVHTDKITNATYFAQQANYTIYTHHTGRYVRIELPKDNGLLIVCEVEVFEVCPEHFYGDDCSDACGRCKNSNTCHPSNGDCQHGCEPGFLPNMCTTECIDGYFGYNCLDKCGQCKHKHPCNKTNGQCIACAAGYRGATCLQECAKFKYGDGCQLECGRCKDNIPCNHINGSCDSCDAGFRLPLCKTACTNGWYGENCRLKCGNCRGDAACNKSNGHCSSCAAGYTGIICKEKCSNYTYGENCTGKCGHCRYGAACNYVTGLCRNCEKGYNDSDKYCTTECTDGKYGYLCSYRCGRCKNGSVCNKINGTCSHGCAAGYEGHKCNNTCSGKTFGEDCKMKCHCKDDVECDTLTGHCPNDLCDFGWTGHDCSTDPNFVYRLESVTTSMSTPIYQGMNSSLAVDGNDSPLPDTCQCCSVSIADTPWWILDMKKIYPIKLVVFVGRENGYDQFSSFRLYLSNTSDMFGDHVYQAPWRPTNYIIKIPVQNKMASVVKIDRNENILTICEVKIYEGECPLGTYGDRCGNECHCADGLTCDIINGGCKNSGCHPGWLGEACNEECMTGTFGVNCTEQCHCNDNIECNKSTGSCGRSGCAPGWIGLNCSTACDAGLYGLNCSQMCGNCANNMACDKTTGDCVYGCDSKYQGPKCIAGSEMPQINHKGPMDETTMFVLSALVGLSVFVVLLLIALILRHWRKRKIHHRQPTPVEVIEKDPVVGNGGEQTDAAYEEIVEERPRQEVNAEASGARGSTYEDLLGQRGDSTYDALLNQRNSNTESLSVEQHMTAVKYEARDEACSTYQNLSVHI